MNQDGRTVHCPMCGRRTTWRENPHRPFCSERCRMADLNGWLTGRYVVTGDSDEARAASDEEGHDEELSTSEPREKT